MFETIALHPIAPNNTDQELLLRLRQGDGSAFEQIYKEHWEFLYTSCYKVLRHEDDCLDICQSVFMSLWENRQKLQVETNLRAYLFGAIKFKVANLISRGRARFIFTDDIELFDIPHTEEFDIELRELKSYLDHLIDGLPPRCKEVFLLSRQQHLTHREIAEKLDISEKTVDDHISRALKLLRPSLLRISTLFLLFF